MLNIILSILLESHEPVCTNVKRLDGITVQTCDGRVTMMKDDKGNIRQYLGDGAIVIRADWQPIVILERR